MCVLKNKFEAVSWKMRSSAMNLFAKKDSGESHIIAVIAMCVVGVALALILSSSLDTVITGLSTDMELEISSLFTTLTP